MAASEAKVVNDDDGLDMTDNKGIDLTMLLESGCDVDD